MPCIICRSFTDLKPREERIKEGEALALGILLHTKVKQGHADKPHCMEMRYDVSVIYLKEKGSREAQEGW